MDLTYYYTQVLKNPDARPEAKIEAQNFFNSQQTPVAPITPVMPADGTPPVIPTPTPDNTNYGAVTKAVVDTYAQPSAAEKTDADLTARIQVLMDKQQGKTADQSQLETDAGIPQLEKDVSELGTQISQVGIEQTANELKIAKEGISEGGIRGRNIELERNNAIKVLTLSAQLQAKKGNLQIAQDQVSRAVDLKYKPIEDEINNKLKLIDLNKDNLTAEQKKRADLLQAQLEDQKQVIADKKADDNQKSQYALTVAQNGAPNSLIAQINNAKTADEALGIAAASGFMKEKPTTASIQEYEYAKSQGYKGTYEQYQNDDANRKLKASGAGATGADKLLSITEVQNYQASYPDAGINAGDTVASANAKVAKLVGPKTGTEADFTAIANQEKASGKTYEQVVADINSNAMIANKDLAIKSAGQVFGKTGAPAPTNNNPAPKVNQPASETDGITKGIADLKKENPKYTDAEIAQKLKAKGFQLGNIYIVQHSQAPKAPIVKLWNSLFGK